MHIMLCSGESSGKDDDNPYGEQTEWSYLMKCPATTFNMLLSPVTTLFFTLGKERRPNYWAVGNGRGYTFCSTGNIFKYTAPTYCQPPHVPQDPCAAVHAEIPVIEASFMPLVLEAVIAIV